MRTVVICASVFLVGCEPLSADQVLADPSTTISANGDLSDVQLIGEIGTYWASTRDGWGSAYAWYNTTDNEPGFTIDVRGEGDGVVMSWVQVEGIDFSELRLGDELNIEGLNQNPWPIETDGMGCSGYADDSWSYDYENYQGTLTVIDQDEDSTTIAMDLGIYDSWTKAALVLPTRLPMRDW